MNTCNPSINGILPSGCGAWDITQHPFGGDFMRCPQLADGAGMPVRIIGEHPEKPGWIIAECERPNRPGTRRIVSNQIKAL